MMTREPEDPLDAPDPADPDPALAATATALATLAAGRGYAAQVTLVGATGARAAVTRFPAAGTVSETAEPRTRLPSADRPGDFPDAASRETAAARTAQYLAGLEAGAIETLQTLAATEATLKKRHAWRGTLATLLAVTIAELKRFSLPEAEAVTMATAITRAQAHYLGGRHHYLPTGRRLDEALRDERICRDFDGRNLTVLARREGLTETRIRQILAAARKARR